MQSDSGSISTKLDDANEFLQRKPQVFASHGTVEYDF